MVTILLSLLGLSQEILLLQLERHPAFDRVPVVEGMQLADDGAATEREQAAYSGVLQWCGALTDGAAGDYPELHPRRPPNERHMLLFCYGTC